MADDLSELRLADGKPECWADSLGRKLSFEAAILAADASLIPARRASLTS